MNNIKRIEITESGLCTVFLKNGKPVSFCDDDLVLSIIRKAGEQTETLFDKLKKLVREDVYVRLNKKRAYFDNKILWDEDEDERIYYVCNKLYDTTFYHKIKYIGEHEGKLSVFDSKKDPLTDFEKQYITDIVEDGVPSEPIQCFFGKDKLLEDIDFWCVEFLDSSEAEDLIRGWLRKEIFN